MIKRTEDGLGIRLFRHRAGVFVPAAKARAMRSIQARYSDLTIDLNILKIKEMSDYLLPEGGEVVIMRAPVETSAIHSAPLAGGRIVAIVPEGPELAGKARVSVHDLLRFPFIGINPDDPYGAALARPVTDAGLGPRHMMQGRFAQTMVSLVRHGIGVAVIDAFSVAQVYMPALVRISLRAEARLSACSVQKLGRQLSGFAELTIKTMQHELAAATAQSLWERPKAV